MTDAEHVCATWATITNTQTGAARRLLVNEITSDQLDQLYERAERAEATIARVRSLSERWKCTGDRKGGPRTELLTALTGEPHHPAAP